MTAHQSEQGKDQAWETRRRRAGITAFLAGVAATLLFFGFLPGLPHVIDWGAILTAVAVGALAQWGSRRWMTGRAARDREPT